MVMLNVEEPPPSDGPTSGGDVASTGSNLSVTLPSWTSGAAPSATTKVAVVPASDVALKFEAELVEPQAKAKAER
jgi:hypothetical protein